MEKQNKVLLISAQRSSNERREFEDEIIRNVGYKLNECRRKNAQLLQMVKRLEQQSQNRSGTDVQHNDNDDRLSQGDPMAPPDPLYGDEMPRPLLEGGEASVTDPPSDAEPFVRPLSKSKTRTAPAPGSAPGSAPPVTNRERPTSVKREDQNLMEVEPRSSGLFDGTDELLGLPTQRDKRCVIEYHRIIHFQTKTLIITVIFNMYCTIIYNIFSSMTMMIRMQHCLSLLLLVMTFAPV